MATCHFPLRSPRVLAATGILILLAAGAHAVPSITTQPRDDTFVLGQTAGFRVGATGTGTLSFQWYRDGVALAGATGLRHYTAPIGAADAGAAYHVVVTDDDGTLASSAGRVRLATYRAAEAIPLPDPATATYHLAAVDGSDTTGDGSAARPFQTFAKVRPLLRGGELVLFHDGDYGDLSISYTQNEIRTPYTDWVVFMAAPGAGPRLGKFYLHGNWNPTRVVWNGNFDFRVRLIGFTVADGVELSDANLVRIERCAIRRLPPWNGSTAAISKGAVGIRGGRSITVEDCDITETAVGIGVRGNDLVFRRNHIHEICHDGISLTGCDQVLVEGNRIHNLDDGADDGTPENPAPAWNRHCDGMHLFMETDGDPVDANVGITIRGNTIYHCESMGIMYQNRSTQLHLCRDFVVENNVFGPSGGFLLHFKDTCLGFVFRHNSLVHVEGDQYQGRYRTIACGSYAVGLPTYATSTGVEVYNNILHGQTTNWGWIKPAYAARFDHNLYYRWGVSLAQGDAPLVLAGEPFANAPAHDATLVAGCAAIDAGSPLGPVGFDLRGVARDAAPDIGAFEAVPATSYATWAAGAGLAGFDAFPLADAESDGLANLLEYGFATDPCRATGADQRPFVGLDSVAGVLAFTHRRRASADLVWSYEASTDLAVWEPVAPTTTVVDPDVAGDGGTELVRALLPLEAGDTRRFLRLSVTAP